MADEARVVILANSNLSRGKYAAAAVHAALMAAGVHPGTAVIVLGAPTHTIEESKIVVRDAGKTEVEPGTITAGTDWAPLPLMTRAEIESAARTWRVMADSAHLIYASEEPEERGRMRGLTDGYASALEMVLRGNKM